MWLKFWFFVVCNVLVLLYWVVIVWFKWERNNCSNFVVFLLFLIISMCLLVGWFELLFELVDWIFCFVCLGFVSFW